MTADSQNDATKIRRHGRDAGYIVVNPQQANRWWVPSRDHPRIVSFLREMIVSYSVDPTRVHVTGFSQGAFATWNILCQASDVVCSVAPLSSSGLDPWGGDYIANQNCFATDSGPPNKRSIMYHTGTFDTMALLALQPVQANNVFNDYGINQNQCRAIAGSDIYNVRREYTVPGAAGVKFQTGVFGQLWARTLLEPPHSVLALRCGTWHWAHRAIATVSSVVRAHPPTLPFICPPLPPPTSH